MLGLADAARSRSEADWLVGINGTRAMTAFNSRDGGFFLTTVGRVQTPTLSIVVEREEKIRKHVSRDYWEVQASFDARPASTTASGSTRSGRRTPTTPKRGRPPVERGRGAGHCRRRARPAGHRDGGGQAQHAGQPAAVRPDHAAARGQRRASASGQDHAVAGAGAVREAQGADLPAYRQRHLPEDYLGGGEARPSRCWPRGLPGPLRELAPHARKALDEGYVKPTKRIFDNAKVSDHFAIIPTLQAPGQPDRGRGQAVRHGGQALHGGVLSERPNTWSPPASPP
jgi:DNA topoisomerase-3